MAASGTAIVVKFIGDARQLTSGVRQATSGLDKFKSQVKVAAVAVGAAALAIGAGLVKIGGDFQEAYNNIIGATGATGDALDGLKKDFKATLAGGPEGFGDVSVAIGELNTRLGLTGKPLQDVTRQMLDLSRITGSDVKSTIVDTTRLFGDWGIATKDQAATLDKLFQATKDSGIGLGELSKSVVQFGAPLRQLGFSFDQSVGIFEKWHKEGVNTTTVMSGMRTMLGKVAKAGKDPVKSFKEITAQIKNAGTAGEANAIALKNFGARAAGDMAAAIREGRFEIDDFVKSLKNSDGSIKDVSDRTKTFQQKMDELKNRGFVAIEPIATKFLDLTLRMAGALASASDWAGRHTTTVKVLAVVIGTLAAVVLTAGIAIKTYELATKVARAATLLWQGAMWLLNAAFLANPIVGVTLLIVAIGAAVVLAYRKFDTFRAIVNGAWGVLKSGFNWIKSNWPLLLAILTGPFGLAVFGIVKHFDAIVSFAKGVPGRIKDGIGKVTGTLVSVGEDLVKGMIDGLKNGSTWLYREIKTYLVDKPKHLITHPWEIFSPSKVTRRYGQFIVQGLAVGITDSSKKVTDALQTVTDKAKEKISDAKDVAKGIRDAFTIDLSQQTTTVGDKERKIPILESLRSQAVQAEAFAKRIKSLRKKGLDAGLIEQLVSSGPSSLASANELAGNIGGANKLARRINAAGSSLSVSEAKARTGINIEAPNVAVSVSIDGKEVRAIVRSEVKEQNRNVKRAVTAGARRAAPA